MRVRLKWLPIAFAVVIILISFLLLYSYFKKTIISWEEERLLNAADSLLVQIAARPDTFERDPREFLLVHDKSELSASMILVQIMDTHGQVLARSSNLRSTLLPFDTRNEHCLTDVVLPSGEYLKLYQDTIMVNEQNIGALIVGMPRAQVIHALQKLSRILIVVFFGLIIILAYGINALLSTEIIAAQKKYLSFISHELRTALFALSGKAEVALRGNEDAAQYKKNLQEIYTESQGLTNLVNDLLLLLRKEYFTSIWKTTTVAITDVAVEAVANVKARYPERSYILNVCSPLWVQGDSMYLRQLLINIIDNAAKYSAAQGKIMIQILPHGKKCSVVISDTGIGIDKKYHKKIFDPFFRASNKQQGMGLGLAIAKWIIEAHKGALVVQSTPGKGTQVKISLPLA